MQRAESQAHRSSGGKREDSNEEGGKRRNGRIRQVNERKREKETMEEDGVNFDYGGPLGCSEKGERKRKSTAGRNLSNLSFISPFMVKVKLSHREQEVILNHAVAQSY